jgi:hypothetical protein
MRIWCITIGISLTFSIPSASLDFHELNESQQSNFIFPFVHFLNNF